MDRNISKTSKIEILDKETGELTTSINTETYKIDKEPAYIKMYISDIARIKEVPSGMEKILMEMVCSMGYNNVIVAYKPIKDIICKRLGISIHYLNKAIGTFKKKGLLISVARGVYIADPELFARGNWADIKNLRLVIDYKEDGSKELQSNLPEEVQLKLGL